MSNVALCKPIVQNRSGIVGGKVVDASDPDQKLVSMLKIRRGGRDHVCTAALLSERVLLTAAHCVDGASTGSIDAFFVTSQGCPVNQIQTKSFEVAKYEVHNEFDGTPESFSDVALVLLDQPAPDDQSRIPLLSPKFPPTSDEAILLGFGITDEKQSDSQTLRKITKSLKRDFKFEERKIQVDQSHGAGGFCRGDSGAPVIVEVWGEYKIAGVNSANVGLIPNSGCQTASVAMNTVFFADWIAKTSTELEAKSFWDYVKTITSYVF